MDTRSMDVVRSVIPARAWRIHHMPHERARREWVASRPSVVSALDVGCGYGFFTSAIPARRVTACDINETRLEGARNFLADNHITHVQVRYGDARSLPFADDSVDAVYCLETLEHIRHAEWAARELQRVSRGHVFVTVPAHGHLTETAGHVQDFTEESLSAMFDNVIMCETREPFIYLVSLSQGAAPSGNRGGTPGVLE